MIRPEKFNGALAALQAVLIHARKLAYDGEPHRDIADLLDSAEILPSMICSDADETERFRLQLLGIGERHRWWMPLERFDGAAREEDASASER